MGNAHLILDRRIIECLMHIITQKRLKEFWQKYPDSENSLRIWYDLTRASNWNNLTELGKVFLPPIKLKI